MKTQPKKRQHYVDNQEFLAAIIKYREKVLIAKEKGLPKPRVSNYIGGCFLKIATHLSYRPNFINYMYKDDMVCDGIENCIQYIDNFDPAKSKNPFAYFTRLYTMLSSGGLLKKRDRWISRTKSLRNQVTTMYLRLTETPMQVIIRSSPVSK